MEGRKLNLNAPLLSVRRISSSTQLNGETRKPTQNSASSRQHNLPFDTSELNSDQVTKPATVPFQWEQFPGRPKNDSGLLQELPVTPRLPPAKSLNQSTERPQLEAFSLTENVYQSEGYRELIEDFYSKDDDDDDDDEYDDEFSDALENLSPGESFSLNCSMSGLSGSSVGGLNVSESSSRDFMMKRFLPAAKAMTLETPQYASKKQPVSAEQPRQIVKVVVSQDKPATPRKYRADIIPQFAREEAAEESEDEQENFDLSAHVTTKGCRLLPRLCFRNSLCILNPVSGLKLKTQNIKSSDLEVQRLDKPQFPSKYVTKNSQDASTKNKSSSGRDSPRLQVIKNKLINGSKRLAFSGELQTKARLEEVKHKLLNGSKRLAFSGELRTRDSSVSRSSSPMRSFFSINTKTKSSSGKDSSNLPDARNNFTIGSKRLVFSGELQPRGNFSPGTRSANSSPRRSFFSLGTKNKSSSGKESPNQLESKNKPVSGSRRLAYSGELQTRNSSSPYRRSVSGTVSPYRNVTSISPYQGVGIRGDPKRIESCSISMLNIYDKQRKNLRDVSSYLRNENVSCSGSPAIERTVYIDTVNDANSHPTLSSSERKQQTSRLPVNNIQDSRGLKCSTGKSSGFLDAKKDRNAEENKSGSINHSSEESSLPPLPKSPSESWLWRTLPSISSRNLSNSFLSGHLPSKKLDSDESSIDTKWETIVKTSRVHADHVRYSEELITLSSHTRKA